MNKIKKGVLAEIYVDKINPQKKEAAEGVKLKLLHNIYNVRMGCKSGNTNSPHHVKHSCYATVQMFV